MTVRERDWCQIEATKLTEKSSGNICPEDRLFAALLFIALQLDRLADCYEEVHK